MLLLLIVTAIAMAMPGAHAVNCYQCSSERNSNCNDPDNKANIAFCSGTYCTKTSTSYKGITHLKVHSFALLTFH
jgi:hypothetical protein